MPHPALAPARLPTGVKYILTANLHAEDPAVAKAQIDRMRSKLPSWSIVAFGIGNEPDMCVGTAARAGGGERACSAATCQPQCLHPMAPASVVQEGEHVENPCQQAAWRLSRHMACS